MFRNADWSLEPQEPNLWYRVLLKWRVHALMRGFINAGAIPACDLAVGLG